MKFANVAINLPVKNLFKQYTYIIPEEFSCVDVGWRVVVPFGMQTLEGFVVARDVVVEEPSDKFRAIEALIDTKPWFDQEMLSTAKWISEYYLCTLAEAMRLFIPGKGSLNKAKKDQAYEIKIRERFVNVFKITASGLAQLECENKKIPAQMKALRVLATGENFTVGELAKANISSSILHILHTKQWVMKTEERVLRDSYAGVLHSKEAFTLTEEQKNACRQITAALEHTEQQTFLLQGVTSSGKTEVYLRITAEALAQQKQVLVLVPEIALTGQTVQRFKSWFGERVAVAHSKLSQNERADVWHKMRTGLADVLIGVRSAVFAPFANLGLVIIDEEHEASYKQEERPNYHARAVALKRCQLRGIPLVLGSATPDVCSYYHATTGRYRHLILTKRASGSLLPTVEIVDMRKELQSGNKGVLSKKLTASLLQTIEESGQAVILLNRRGYSTFVMCRDCGEAVVCPHCAVALVYHSSDKIMRCHYCGNTAVIPDECPHCHSRRIKFFGTGTQKAETEIAEVSEKIKAVRMDQDSTSKKFAHETILKAFSAGKYNILLGTQMVAKGHDIPNVTLVGILSADSQLNLPDFRAGERTFSLLTQAAGRAGRGDKPGKVIFQTYDADNEIIKLAAQQDYDAFAKLELQQRQELSYPPFTQLLKIVVVDKVQMKGNETAQRIVNYLEGACLLTNGLEAEIMGPFPAIVEKVRDLYRINILIKTSRMSMIKEALLASEFKEMKNVYFDVDPISVV